MKFFVYVLGTFCKKKAITYVGWSKDPKARLKKHNSGKGAKFTRGKKWKLLYYEELKNKNEALRREYKIKKDKRLRKKLLINLT